MANPTDTPPRPKTEAELRAERLAAELRSNLQRRKRQVRGRDEAATQTPVADDDPR